MMEFSVVNFCLKTFLTTVNPWSCVSLYSSSGICLQTVLLKRIKIIIKKRLLSYTSQQNFLWVQQIRVEDVPIAVSLQVFCVD